MHGTIEMQPAGKFERRLATTDMELIDGSKILDHQVFRILAGRNQGPQYSSFEIMGGIMISQAVGLYFHEVYSVPALARKLGAPNLSGRAHLERN